MRAGEEMYSVVYQTGRLTAEDYDEAIAGLQAAKKALTEGESSGCAICEDSGCASNICHHNVLLLARRWAQESRVTWRCYHCDFVAHTYAEAKEHFGTSEAEIARCLKETPDAR